MTGGKMESRTENETPEFGGWSIGDWTLAQRLSALAAFLPVLSAPAFLAGEWIGAEQQGDAIVMGSFELGPGAKRFLQTAYDYGWVIDFDWPAWNRTEEAQALYHDPDVLAHASIIQLAKLLTARIRIDRFCDGALAADFKSGLMMSVAERATALLTIR
jgi:hypothetical protein